MHKKYAFVVGYSRIIDSISVRDIVHLSRLLGTKAPSASYSLGSSLPEGAFLASRQRPERCMSSLPLRGKGDRDSGG